MVHSVIIMGTDVSPQLISGGRLESLAGSLIRNSCEKAPVKRLMWFAVKESLEALALDKKNEFIKANKSSKRT